MPKKTTTTNIFISKENNIKRPALKNICQMSCTSTSFLFKLAGLIAACVHWTCLGIGDIVGLAIVLFSSPTSVLNFLQNLLVFLVFPGRCTRALISAITRPIGTLCRMLRPRISAEPFVLIPLLDFFVKLPLTCTGLFHAINICIAFYSLFISGSDRTSFVIRLGQTRRNGTDKMSYSVAS